MWCVLPLTVPRRLSLETKLSWVHSAFPHSKYILSILEIRQINTQNKSGIFYTTVLQLLAQNKTIHPVTHVRMAITTTTAVGLTCWRWAVESGWGTFRVLSSSLCSLTGPHSYKVKPAHQLIISTRVKTFVFQQWKPQMELLKLTNIKPPPRTPRQIGSERRPRGRSRRRGLAGTRPSRHSFPPAFPSPSTPTRSAHTYSEEENGSPQTGHANFTLSFFTGVPRNDTSF